MNLAAKAQCPEDGFLSAESPWNGEKYGLIYADCPWKYANYTDKAHGAAAAHYAGMTLEQLAALDIARYAEEDASLCMWATWPKLDEAMKLGEAWGFRYITGFPWVKYVPSYADAINVTDPKTGVSYFHVKQGCGFVVYQCSEPLLWWRRGDPKRDADFVKQVGLLTGMEQRTFWAPLNKGVHDSHSRKAPEIRWQLGQEYKSQKKLELFATEFCPGWTSWGASIGTILTKDGVFYADPAAANRQQWAHSPEAAELPIEELLGKVRG